KTGIKASGILIAFGSTFCIKLGSGLGTALAAWILNSFGYVPNNAQSGAGLVGSTWAFIWAPALLFALAAMPLLFF
ncbi:MFS transporter, partial [Salmonella enterica]|uniref:MFS transporter n=1 Tax=Salmonella enterica TaxID=28901 RepID=UPI00329A7E8D